MTLRDYFAGRAMEMIAHTDLSFDRKQHDDAVASRAYLLADAMIKAREL